MKYRNYKAQWSQITILLNSVKIQGMRGFSHFQLHFPYKGNSNYDNNNQRQFNVIYLSLVASSSCVNRAIQKQIQQHRPFKMLRVLYCSAVNKCYELIQSNAFELS